MGKAVVIDRDPPPDWTQASAGEALVKEGDAAADQFASVAEKAAPGWPAT